MSDIRALTVRRPWSSLIAAGWKTVENRVWERDYRGPLLIHAGHGWEPTARWHAQDLVLAGDDSWQPDRHPHGIVAVVDLTGVCSDTPCGCGPWAMDGYHHWQLANARRLNEPVPAKGLLGLWRPAPDVLAAVEAQVGALT